MKYKNNIGGNKMIIYNITEVIYNEEGFAVTTINNQLKERHEAINMFQTRRNMLLNTKDNRILIDTFDFEKDMSKFKIMSSDCCEIELTLYTTQLV
jgi:hypothetical protein